MKKEIIGITTAIAAGAGTLVLLSTTTDIESESHITDDITEMADREETSETTICTTPSQYVVTTALTSSYTTTYMIPATTESTTASTTGTTSITTTTKKMAVTSNHTTSKVPETTVQTTVTKSEAQPIGVSKNNLKLVGTFKGTYYAGKTAPCKGGSGRTLIDCSTHGQGVKGSIAAKAIYQKYGYKKNGRTKVYVECSGMPSMTGWYYVDDCCGSSSVVDFYYYRNANCPFRKSGVISVKVYI